MNEWDRLGGSKLEDNIYGILISRYSYQVSKEMEFENNKENLIEYKKLIQEASLLVSSLSLPNNSISMSVALSMLVKSGAFSVDNRLINEALIDKIILKPGIELVKGIGSCRHVNGFQKNVFEELEIPIEDYTCDLSENSKEEDINGDSNHIANVIIYNGVYYLSDIYNDLLGRFTDSNIAKSSENYHFYYKPDFLMRYFELEKDEITERLNKYKKSSLDRQISKKEYHQMHEETLRIMFGNTKLIREFKDDTANLKEKIIKKSK